MEKDRKLYKFVFFITRCLYKVEIIKVEDGKQRLIKYKDLPTEFKIEDGRIVLSNHVRAIDPIFNGIPFGTEQKYVIAKKELFKPVINKILTSAGAIKIDRGYTKESIRVKGKKFTIKTIDDPIEANRTLLKAMRETRRHLSDKKLVLFYAEGERNKDNDTYIFEFQKGTAPFIKLADGKVIAMFIKYQREQGKLRTRVKIYVSEQIDLGKGKDEEITERARQLVMSLPKAKVFST
jgi:1-acyl-sn-glycerol-3-phosphate acyltransferase